MSASVKMIEGRRLARLQSSSKVAKRVIVSSRHGVWAVGAGVSRNAMNRTNMTKWTKGLGFRD